MAISTSAADIVYNAATHYNGPFANQASNNTIQSGFPDLSNVKFECTLSPLQMSGTVASTIFYECPTDGWDLAKGTTINTQVLAITLNQVNSNLSNTR